ncbi:hypothetical protein KI688_006525 [Linnemannia hyalina]|uniref:Crinkler effector protein N-terminal domain-containing protein n=1 Tax=Linnemannia hyalina TaxID=64524 RepID=A0A9P7XKJ7_9FUNG|nr:hypothetical protein KI688_006525 [Linnemannia hyalina]
MADNSLSLSLRCLVDGDRTSKSFELATPSTESFGQLRTTIRLSKPIWFKDLEAEDLTLWKVTIPITKDNADTPILLKNVPDSDKDKLGPTDDVIEWFPQVPDKKTIHIIVQRPLPASPTQLISVQSGDIEKELAEILEGTGHHHINHFVDSKAVESSQRQKLAPFYKRTLPYHDIFKTCFQFISRKCTERLEFLLIVFLISHVNVAVKYKDFGTLYRIVSNFGLTSTSKGNAPEPLVRRSLQRFNGYRLADLPFLRGIPLPTWCYTLQLQLDSVDTTNEFGYTAGGVRADLAFLTERPSNKMRIPCFGTRQDGAWYFSNRRYAGSLAIKFYSSRVAVKIHQSNETSSDIRGCFLQTDGTTSNSSLAATRLDFENSGTPLELRGILRIHIEFPDVKDSMPATHTRRGPVARVEDHFFPENTPLYELDWDNRYASGSKARRGDLLKPDATVLKSGMEVGYVEIKTPKDSHSQSKFVEDLWSLASEACDQIDLHLRNQCPIVVVLCIQVFGKMDTYVNCP